MRYGLPYKTAVQWSACAGVSSSVKKWVSGHSVLCRQVCLCEKVVQRSFSTCAGMKDGQQIRFSGEGDQEPGSEPGDIVIVLDEKEHPQFRRRGTDLIMQKELTLVEALCGFHKTIKLSLIHI